MTAVEQALTENPCPSRCPDCNTRRLKPDGWTCDAWDQPSIAGWQCLDCGRVWEGKKIGKTWRYFGGRPKRIILQPGELKEMIPDNYKRAGIERPERAESWTLTP